MTVVGPRAAAGALLVAIGVVAACRNGRSDLNDGVARVHPSRPVLYTPTASTSVELAAAVALRCTATPREEAPADPVAAGGFPGMYRRDFELAGCTSIRGEHAPVTGVLRGYTRLAPLQRADDGRDPTLVLDGQRFFDRPAAGPIEIVVLLGGAAVTPAPGAKGQVAALLGADGTAGSEPARAFALTGADRELAAALPALVGWQGARSPAALAAALAAGHPLVAIDAMRIAIADGAADAIEAAARELLHPSRPAAVRVAAVEPPGAAILASAPGSPEAERLIVAALAGWEAERRSHVDSAYADALTGAVPQLKAAAARSRARAFAADHQIERLVGVLRQLAAELE